MMRIINRVVLALVLLSMVIVAALMFVKGLSPEVVNALRIWFVVLICIARIALVRCKG